MTKPHDARKDPTDMAPTDLEDEEQGVPPAGEGADAADSRPDEATASAGPSAAEQIAQLKDKWLRARAELDNVQRRSRNDVEDARRYGATPLLLELLGVLDALQRALAQAQERPAADSQLVQGLELTERLFLTALENHGVAPVSAGRGEAFDPSCHRALVEQPVDDLPAGAIVAELVRGYRLRDRLLREAQVAVARRPDEPGGPAPRT